MRVLVVCSFNRGEIAPFIRQQTLSVQKTGIETEYFLIKGKGLMGYISNYRKLKNHIQVFNSALIHAHYGLSGLLANFQRKIPVITSFHGSDINLLPVRWLSKIACQMSAWSVFVSKSLAQSAGAKKKYSVIPCGIDLNSFFPVPKTIARQKLGIHPEEKIILFAGSFTNKIKNYALARETIDILNTSRKEESPVKLIQLDGYSSEEVNLLLNACDVALLTSFSEGSPNFVKEAMACNCPVVATDVGDIREISGNLEGHYLTTFEVNDVAEKLKSALTYAEKHPEGTMGRLRIVDLELDEDSVAEKLIHVYETVIGSKIT